MSLFLVRHGQTDWNAEARFQGQRDIDLNDLGRAQAKQNGARLATLLGDTVSDFDFVSSPMSRTRETMELARSAMGLDPKAYRTDSRLVEICFGDWEGLTLAELSVAFPDRMKERHASKWDFLPPGDKAESFEMLSMRSTDWLNSVYKPTVCVTHGGIIRTFLVALTGMAKDEAANLDIVQDKVLKIVGDQAEWL
jgi:broad specificity phosphatase PhoE